MKQKNIDNTLDINKPIKSLGIYQIKEEKTQIIMEKNGL